MRSLDIWAAASALVIAASWVSHTAAQSAAASTAPAPRADAPLPESLRPDSFRLWPGRAPRASSDAATEMPTLTVFRPQRGRASGAAVVIAPGGAYMGLATGLEGVEPAAWFTARGVTAFVLTYRVGEPSPLPTPLLDGPRAIRLVRARAAEFGVNPSLIGMMGFSAGGHLAATTAVEATPGRVEDPDPVERVSSRPDFLILSYPWLEGMTLRADGTSSYCDIWRMRRAAPCDDNANAAYIPTPRVTAEAPPTFIYQTGDDAVVPAAGVVRFYVALLANKVPAELHIFEKGTHGTGLGGQNPALSRWPDLLQEWLRQRGVLEPR